MQQCNSPSTCSHSVVKAHLVSCVKAIFVILGKELTQGGGCLHPGKVCAFLSTHLLSVAPQSSDGLGLKSKELGLNYVLQPPTPPASLS